MTESGSQSPEVPQGEELTALLKENAALKSRLDTRLRWRRILTVVLVVLTSLSVVTSAVAIWAHQTLFDTDQFMATIEPALEDPALYDALGDRVTDEVLTALDLETRVSDALGQIDQFLAETIADALELGPRARQLLSTFDRPSLTALGPPIVEALEGRVERRIDGFFSSEEFMTRFPTLVRRVHEVSVALIRNQLDELPNVYIADGEVRLNLIPIIAEALRNVAEDIRGFLPDIQLPDVVSDRVDEARDQLAAAIQAELPDDFGQLTVMSEDALVELQDAGAAADRYVWGLLILTIVLATLTMVISPNRRRTAIQLGLGVVVAMALTAVIVRQVEDAVLGQITSPSGGVAASSMLGAVLSSLRTLELVVAIVGVVVAVIMYLVGRPRWLTGLTQGVREATAAEAGGSRLDKWVAKHADLVKVAAAAIAVLILFLVGWDWLALIVVGVILGLVLWWVSEATKRVTADEPETAPIQ